MNRKTILLALGATAVMTGLAFGTGAFTQVEAERTVDVQVADDSTAFLQIQSIADNYTDTSGNALAVNLDGASSAAGTGVNDNAVTKVDPLFNITNQGTQEIEVTEDSNIAGVELLGLQGGATLGVGDTVEVGINVSTNSDRQINAGTVSGSLSEDVVINATATP